MLLGLFIISVVVTAFIYAALEIQIEGKNGWASKLPTWKINNRFTELFGVKRSVTGYHILSNILFFIIAHFSFVFVDWTIKREAVTLSYILLFLVLEDFLWFAINPYFGIRRFNKRHVPWHVWVLGLPLEYWIQLPIGLLLLFFGLN